MKKLLISLLFLNIFTSVFSQSPDRSGPPALGQVKNLELPAPVRFTLSNGLKVVLMEKHNVPMVQVNLLIQTGNYDDPIGKEGLASFAMDALDEGAGDDNAVLTLRLRGRLRPGHRVLRKGRQLSRQSDQDRSARDAAQIHFHVSSSPIRPLWVFILV